MDYYYNINDISTSGSYPMSNATAVPAFDPWAIIALVLAVVGGLLVYFLFVRAKTEPSNRFLKWLKDFLSFKTMWIEAILKVLYYCATIYVVLISFSLIAFNFAAFLAVLIIAPVLIRVVYEAVLIMVMIWRNTQVIAQNTGCKTSEKCEKCTLTSKKAKETKTAAK